MVTYFFSLGLLAGSLVTRTVKSVFQQIHQNEDDIIQAASEKLKTKSESPEKLRKTTLTSWTQTDTCRSSGDPCDSVCRFSNPHKNCWMNASLQAVLNLSRVQEMLKQPVCEIPPLITPKFEVLFFNAIVYPGKSFGPKDICRVLKELSEKIPSLQFDECNNIRELLEPLLTWLQRCGVQTMTTLKELIICKECGFSTASVSHQGNICLLESPREQDSISSLSADFFSFKTERVPCVTCGSEVTTGHVWILPDVLTLCLPRTVEEGHVFLEHVTPCETLEIPVSDSTTQKYSLSSVMCHSGLQSSARHVWTFLRRNNVTIKADDCNISITETHTPKHMYYNGIIYFYEKCN